MNRLKTMALAFLIFLSGSSMVFVSTSWGTPGIFTDSGQNLGNSHSMGVALGDLDADGDLDAFVANTGNQANKVWLNDGSGIFTDSGQNLGSSHSHGMALGDLDGDGDLDAFVANSGQPNKVWLNDGNGNFTDSGQNLGSALSLRVALGDVDGDGDLDAFVGNEYANKVWLNDGNGSFTDSSQNLGNSGSRGVALGDVDGDGDLDAFVANTGPAFNKLWLNDGNGNFTDSGQNLGSSNSHGVALGDVDEDGDLDALVANLGEANKVWLNDGNGNFTDSGQNLGSSASYSVTLGDVDGDTDLDAFVANHQGQANRVWSNDGNGNFTDSGQNLGSSDSYVAALGDVDGDTDLDAFVANGSPGPNKVWLNGVRAYYMDWAVVQHRIYEDGRNFHRLMFAIRDSDTDDYVPEDIVDTVTLIDPDGNPVTLPEIIFDPYREMNGSYKADSGQWYYDDQFHDTYLYKTNFDTPLIAGTYQLTVTDIYGKTYQRDCPFNGYVNLPLISASTFRARLVPSKNLIWEWKVPYYLHPTWETSVMAFISIYDGDGNYVGEAYIRVPTHLGRLFVPNNVVKKIAAEGTSFSLNIQFRTNDNNNRRYSNPFPFP